MAGTDVIPFNLWLRRQRKELDLTQWELAERIGCSAIAVVKLEAGERRPSRQIAELLADTFNVPSDERAAFVRYARREPHHAEGVTSFTGDAVADRTPWRSVHLGQTNLPSVLTHLIGREEEEEALHDLLLDKRKGARLTTLTGPPGIGKTRLSIEVASDLLDQFEDGVFFVDLAPVREPDGVVRAIAGALGVTDAGGQPLRQTVLEYVRGKRMLLVLDNFEQVLAASTEVVTLLEGSPWLKVLVTSRGALHVRGERLFRVPPLQLPDLAQFDVGTILSSPAVVLFIERVQTIDPDFALTEQSAEAIAAICVGLEGLPLAIELAAGHITTLTPQEIHSQLESRLRLLRGGSRDLPARQQTLHNAIDWSYDLLSEGEQMLFRRLGVFVGGCSIRAVEAICNARMDLPIGVIEGLGALLDKSLLRKDVQFKRESLGVESHYSMLEMIREYAAEQLERSGEGAEMKRLHTEYHLLFAETAASQIETPEQATWLSRLESMHDNMRAALQWTQSSEGDPQLGLRLAVALAPFWIVHSHFFEARDWFSTVLSRFEGQQPTTLLARAYAKAGRLAFRQSDYAAARRYYDGSLAIGRELGDMRSVGIALAGLGDAATEEGKLLEASHYFEDGLATIRNLEDPLLLADCLVGAGWASMERGKYDVATEQFEEALALCRRIEDKEVAAWALSGLGEVAERQGKYERAVTLLEESLILRRAIDDKWGTSISLGALAWAVMRQADYAHAKELLRESILLRAKLGDTGGIALCLGSFAEIESLQGDLARAATLYAAAYSVRQSVASAIGSLDRWSEHERNIALEHVRMDGATWDSAWAAGLALSLEQAVAFALR